MQPLQVLIKHGAAAPGLCGRSVLRLASSGEMEEGRKEEERVEPEEKK